MEIIKTWQGDESERKFGTTDALFVPNVNYDLTHHFNELMGQDKWLLNQGFEEYHVANAFQRIQFRLDKSGALITSEAVFACEAEPRQFLFNRPFLIIMRKRGAENPFFVMWVDNAELLCKTTSSK